MAQALLRSFEGELAKPAGKVERTADRYSADDPGRLGCPGCDEASRVGRIGRQVGVVWVAVGEMAEWREDVFVVTAADGAKHVTRLACGGVETFHKSKIAIGRGAQQRVEVCAGMIGDSH